MALRGFPLPRADMATKISIAALLGAVAAHLQTVAEQVLDVSYCSACSLPVWGDADTCGIQSSEGRRFLVATLVAGDIAAQGAAGTLHKKMLFAGSHRYAPAAEYWPVEVDADMMAGIPGVAFPLPTRNVLGMRSAR